MRLEHRRMVSALLVICLLSACAGVSAAALGSAEALSMPETVEPLPYEAVPVYIDGLLCARAYEKAGDRFLSPAALCGYLGLALDWQEQGGRLTLSVPGAYLEGDSAKGYYTANGRYMYAPELWLTQGGELYLPLDILARFFGVSVETQEDRVDISTDGMALISGGEDYYELNYPNDDLFWLAQVINSESRWQPLAGMIGVGNVVMNRVASPNFPDTIFDVVFDVAGVVQFEPVSTGGIYATPDELPQVAARLCLEGYNTVGDSLYFVNPSKGSFWFDDTLQFVMTIADHNFYK